MSGMFHEGSRALQARFDTRRIADRIDGLLVCRSIDQKARTVIEGADCFFLATCDGEGRPSCSDKGGAPGFVTVVDERTIAFPNYDGNGMFLSTGNMLVNPSVGLLFIDFEQGRRIRLNGETSMDPLDPLMMDYPEAQFVVRVRVREVFPNCPRYVHRRRLTAS